LKKFVLVLTGRGGERRQDRPHNRDRWHGGIPHLWSLVRPI